MNLDKNVVLVDKPAGWTSFDVVARIRGAIRADYAKKGLKPTKKQLKVGHAGTLDPFATGLLIVLLGEACSQAERFLKLDKTYEAVVELGKTSSTGDPEGEIKKSARPKKGGIEKSEIKSALEDFIGEIEQTPPAYSAIKVNGERAYKLARKGKEVELPKRRVTIYSVQLVAYKYPLITIRTKVSSGTYIRSLAEDIGEKLGTGAYCRELRRTSVGNFRLSDSLTMEEALETVKNF